MQLTCPCCSARFPIEAALADDAARQAVAAALRLPAPLGELLLRYIALFRPTKRALSWDRAAKLLDELSAPIRAGQVERNGRIWAAPQESWRAALEEMLERRDKLTLPLKSHGYLFEIVAGFAAKGEARIEQQAETDKRYRSSREHSNGPVKAAKVIDRGKGRAGARKMRELLSGQATSDDDASTPEPD